MTTGTGMVNGSKLTGRAGAVRSTGRGVARHMPLRAITAEVLGTYFDNLDGHHPADLYELVLREVEEPLFRAVMSYAEGNQSHAATILGINRGTLRKKLKEYGLAG